MKHAEWIKLVLLPFILSCWVSVAVAQQAGDLELLKIRCRAATGANITHKEDSHKRLMLPTRILFSFYRSIVSEQISADCAFDLSCSRFSIAAIRRFGILKGGLLTADRLTRCHVFVAQETVPVRFNNYTGKVIDVPDLY